MQKMGKFKYLVPNFGIDALPMIVSIIVLAAGLTQAGPLTHQPPELDVGNNSLSSLPLHSGCRYQGSFYTTGEEVPTSEPCLLCECKAAVVCKLRICQEIPVPPPAGCIVVHKARKCCARLVCNNHVHETNRKISREHKLSTANTTLSTTTPIEGTGYCVLDGTVYAEGSAMRSSSLCEYCFCIRGEMKCSSPQCVIPMNGCKPKFRSYACCPTNYDCQESNSSAITQTVPSSTPLPTFLKGCIVKGKRIEEGEPVLPLQLENQTDPCQTCFCMGGVVRCRPLECDKPISGCVPVKEPGHCCPDRYDCGPRDNVTDSVTPTVAALTTKTFQNPLSSSSPPPESQPLPTATSTPRELLTDTTEEVSRTDPTSETTILTQSPLKQDETVTTGPIEKLPQPARQKMTTTGAPLSTGAASSEAVFNVVLKNKSDGGSREERRNKDKHDFQPRNSFEDDEKEDSVPLSFEHQDVDQDSSSSLSYEDTTDQSSSNSEMDQDTEFSPTEENDVEAETAQSYSHSEEFSPSSSEKVSDELSSEVLNSAGLPVEGSNEDVKKSPAATTTVPSEKDESMGYVTTTIADTIFSSSPAVTVAPSSISTSASATVAEENLGVTSNNGPAIVEESYITTTTLPPLTKVEELETANFSSGAISELDEDSGLDAEPAATTVINQDVETTEVSPAMSPTSSPPTSTLNPIPQVLQSVGTTVKNVQFIPFGVEDAVMSPMNDSVYEQVPPAQLAYNNHALKISLIPPTPPKGYNMRQQAGGVIEKTGLEGNAYAVESPQVPAPASNMPQDDLRNAIMDVPVSTSLYSHGYYHRNGIITDDGAKESLEFEVSSRRPFPGQVFDDENDSFKVGPPMPHKRIGGASPSAQQSMSPPETLATLPPMTPTLSVSNPARTYSRFGIQDSAFYRYGLGNPGKNTAPSSPLIPPVPSHHYKIHHHHQQQQQDHQYNPQNNHHRYYNAPEQDRPDYHMPINEDDMAYEDDVEDDEEEISYNEQSAEKYHNPNQQHPFSSSVRTPSSNPAGNLSNRGPSTVPSSRAPLPLTTTTTISPSTTTGSVVKKIGGFSNSSSSSNNFKPAVAYPFTIPKKPPGLDFNLGLKLSGCNIYGKMYNVGDIIRELSSACIRCLCTEFGVQCTALPC